MSSIKKFKAQLQWHFVFFNKYFCIHYFKSNVITNKVFVFNSSLLIFIFWHLSDKNQ